MWGEIDNTDTAGLEAAAEIYVRLIAAQNGQTVFTLHPWPTSPLTAKFFVNGGKQMLNVDFSLDTLGRFTWLNTNFPLKTTHYLDLYYH